MLEIPLMALIVDKRVYWMTGAKENMCAWVYFSVSTKSVILDFKTIFSQINFKSLKMIPLILN